ncbi:ABC transporter ATP-binding protein [Vibrio vulnificus]|nr:ABC transporter ATP-binding protein [Vibrio vulnificus]
MILLNDVKKSYRNGKEKHGVLNGVNLTIKEGEMVAVMGRSGVGKSTLLYILAGLEKPSDGSFVFNDLNIGNLSSSEAANWRKRHVGFVLQNHALIEEKTVFENMALPLRYSSKSKIEIVERVAYLLKELGLENQGDKYPHQLSGGQSQRVAIGRALANNPDLILADEPTGSLDEETEATILNIFKKVNKQGKTFILVTHDESVAKVCDRTVKMKDGRIIEI